MQVKMSVALMLKMAFLEPWSTEKKIELLFLRSNLRQPLILKTCIAQFLFQVDYKPNRQDYTLKNRTDRKAPPDTAKPPHTSQEHNHRNPDGCEKNADNRWRQRLSKSGKSTFGRDLKTHEELGIAQNSQILYAHRNDIRLCNKYPKERFRENCQHQRRKDSPDDNDH